MRKLWVVGIAVAGLLAVMAPSAQAAAPIRSCKGAFQENVRVENIKTIRNSCKLARKLAETYVVAAESDGGSVNLRFENGEPFSCKYRALARKPGRPLAKVACVRRNTRVYFYRTKMNPNPNPNSLEDSSRS